MDKSEFISRVTDRLRSNGDRKIVTLPEHSFYISDDSGNSSEFKVKPTDRTAVYTKDDVHKVLDSIVDEIFNSLKNGEDIFIRGLGTIRPQYLSPRKTRSFDGSMTYDIPGRYVPRLEFSNSMKAATKVYGLNAAEAEKYKSNLNIEYDLDISDDIQDGDC